MPDAWSQAAVNRVAERPVTSPPKCLSIVATPTGTAVPTGGAGTGAGVKPATVNVPEALIPRS